MAGAPRAALSVPAMTRYLHTVLRPRRRHDSVRRTPLPHVRLRAARSAIGAARIKEKHVAIKGISSILSIKRKEEEKKKAKKYTRKKSIENKHASKENINACMSARRENSVKKKKKKKKTTAGVARRTARTYTFAAAAYGNLMAKAVKSISQRYETLRARLAQAVLHCRCGEEGRALARRRNAPRAARACCLA